MDWILLAFLAPVLWAGCNVIDKFLLTKKFNDPYSYQVWLALTSIGIAFFFFSLFRVSFILPFSFIGTLIGFGSTAAVLLYNKAMLVEEASRVIPLCYLSSLFTLPMAYFFLGETLTPRKYLGVFFLLIGAIAISHKKGSEKEWIVSPALKLVLAIAIIYAILSVVEKFALEFIDQFSLLFWLMVGSILGSLSLLVSRGVKKNFLSMVKGMDRTTFSLSFLTTILAYSAYVLFLSALSQGFVSLVMGILLVQPFIVFLYTTVLAVFFPEVIEERIDRASLFLKLIAICLIFLGSLLVTV